MTNLARLAAALATTSVVVLSAQAAHAFVPTPPRPAINIPVVRPSVPVTAVRPMPAVHPGLVMHCKCGPSHINPTPQVPNKWPLAAPIPPKPKPGTIFVTSTGKPGSAVEKPAPVSHPTPVVVHTPSPAPAPAPASTTTTSHPAPPQPGIVPLHPSGPAPAPSASAPASTTAASHPPAPAPHASAPAPGKPAVVAKPVLYPALTDQYKKPIGYYKDGHLVMGTKGPNGGNCSPTIAYQTPGGSAVSGSYSPGMVQVTAMQCYVNS